MFGRKGQGAMEYLMTYGWAILVVMIVGLAMWQLGIFNLGGTSITSSGFPKVKPQLTSCKMTTNGDFSCLFTNGAGTGITVNAATAKTGATDCAVSAPAADTEVGLGDNFQLTSTGCTSGTIDDAYSIDVNITYTQLISGASITHSDTGTIKGPYE